MLRLAGVAGAWRLWRLGARLAQPAPPRLQGSTWTEFLQRLDPLDWIRSLLLFLSLSSHLYESDRDRTSERIQLEDIAVAIFDPGQSMQLAELAEHKVDIVINLTLAEHSRASQSP